MALAALTRTVGVWQVSALCNAVTASVVTACSRPIVASTTSRRAARCAVLKSGSRIHRYSVAFDSPTFFAAWPTLGAESRAATALSRSRPLSPWPAEPESPIPCRFCGHLHSP